MPFLPSCAPYCLYVNLTLPMSRQSCLGSVTMFFSKLVQFCYIYMSARYYAHIMCVSYTKFEGKSSDMVIYVGDQRAKCQLEMHVFDCNSIKVEEIDIFVAL